MPIPSEGPTAALPTQNLKANESSTSEDHAFSGDHLQNPSQNSGLLPEGVLRILLEDEPHQ